MSALDIVLVVTLSLMIAGAFFVAYRSKDKTVFWNPLTMFAAVFSYYFVVGPLIAISFGQTSIYGVDLKEVMWKPWLAGILGLGSIYCGFCIPTKGRRALLADGTGPGVRKIVKQTFYVLFCLGLVGFAYDYYVSGQPLVSMLMPIHASTGVDSAAAEREGFAAGNYLLLLVDVFIPAICMLAAATVRMRLASRIVAVGLPALQVELFYASWGYRHRIVTLLTSLAATTFLLRKKRPSPGLLVLGTSAIVLIAGFIVLSRSYGSGLDMRQLAGMKFSQIFLGGFNDAGTFFTTALVMDSFPTTFPYVGLNPLWIAITLPVPRRWWPGKPLPEFLDQFQYLTGTQGQSTPVVGEHYMMAGWVGVVIGGLVIGLVYRRFWDFYRSNPDNPIVVAIYAVAWALCFPVINRGYLAQTLMEFFFTLLPLVVLFWMNKAAMPARGSVSLSGRSGLF
jgi:hypothetical protein